MATIIETLYDDTYDAYATMMNRGAFLRNLRQMAEEDEAQRDEPSNDETVYDTLQAHYDDYKHMNYREIHFGTVGDSPLVIAQDRTMGKGGFVWDSGYILAEHVSQAEEWQAGNPSVVELGAGTGVTGLIVARQVPQANVHLTDLPELLPLMEMNSSTSKNATAGVLEWGRNVSGQYDVVLGADVVASIYDSYGLAKTIYGLSHRQTKIYLACEDRLAGSIEGFEGHMKKMFDYVSRSKPNSTNKNPKVWIFEISGKRSTKKQSPTSPRLKILQVPVQHKVIPASVVLRHVASLSLQKYDFTVVSYENTYWYFSFLVQYKKAFTLF